MCNVAERMMREHTQWIQSAGNRIQLTLGYFGWYLNVFVGKTGLLENTQTACQPAQRCVAPGVSNAAGAGWTGAGSRLENGQYISSKQEGVINSVLFANDHGNKKLWHSQAAMSYCNFLQVC